MAIQDVGNLVSGRIVPNAEQKYEPYSSTALISALNTWVYKAGISQSLSWSWSTLYKYFKSYQSEIMTV